MKIADLYNNQMVQDGLGRGRVYHIINELKKVLPHYLSEEEKMLFGEFPEYQHKVNAFYFVWIMYVAANATSHSRMDIITSVESLPLLIEHGEYEDSFQKHLQRIITKRQTAFISRVVIYHGSPGRAEIHYSTSDEVLVFQGRKKHKGISRASIINGEVLSELVAMVAEDSVCV